MYVVHTVCNILSAYAAVWFYVVILSNKSITFIGGVLSWPLFMTIIGELVKEKLVLFLDNSSPKGIRRILTHSNWRVVVFW